ncbi:hypothetical protein [Halorientalis halophila]|uniref:hypothetical protein n=1 Tax=Halorientalis halophila TaxID=3108499 RepID=UPI003009E976
MPEFASCYFCGAALDAQIEPYPVVPEDATGDGRPTVDLCPPCRRKLAKVLDVALSAADGATVTATPLAAGPDRAALEADADDYETPGDGDEDAADSEDVAYAVEPDGEATAVEEEDDDAAEAAVEPTVDGDAAETEPAEQEDEATEADESDVADVGGSENGSDPDAEETADADEPTSVDGEGETADDGSSKPSILSTPAAQKVIKLLQNREFPVEREEIEVVASNAYEIPYQDCEDVLDALVQEGYVAEKRGRLVRPEE